MVSATARNLEEVIYDLEEVCWADVREEVHKVNPELASICDQISPGKKYPLLKIRYPYGAEIVNRGEFNIPLVGKGLMPIKDRSIPLHIKRKLGSFSIPLSLILHNDIEVFVEANDRSIPLNFFKPGDLFGIFETMDFLTGAPSDPIWNVTAGARSVFMIPRITDKVGHNRIRKEFGITNDVPPDLANQWKIFKGICNRLMTTEKWHNTILVFTESWFEEHPEDLSWVKFHKYLFKLCWSQSQLLRDTTKFNLLWSSFGDEISSRNLKPRPYLVDTLKHLVSIANGSGVAFKPATTETALPASFIQNAYIDFYNLKSYMPTLMQPCKLQKGEKIVYYSLAFPTVLESSPYVRNAPSIMEDERDIKRLMNTFLRTIKNNDTTVNPIKDVNYEFFHPDTDQYNDILSSEDILLEDPRFGHITFEYSQPRAFCATSPFFRGCIRISKTAEENEG